MLCRLGCCVISLLQDKEGNQVWICPACGGQDDGSPMIGCDGCDAWYHWLVFCLSHLTINLTVSWGKNLYKIN